MNYYYLTCRSLTYAQRVSGALRTAGIRNMVVRTPQKVSRDGCGYAVRIPGDSLGMALGALASANLPPKKVLVIRRDGSTEEVSY